MPETLIADRQWISAPQFVTAREIEVGNDIVFLGTPHRIVAINAYEGPMTKYGCFALAEARDGWGIALYEGQRLEVER